MVNMWRGAVVFVAIASIATRPSVADAEEHCSGGAVRCGDGSCAGADLVCDGTLDCADGADEALELCRQSGRPLFGLILLCQQPWAPLHEALCPEVCREWPGYCYYAISAEHGAPGTCVLPQPSKRGAYSIVDVERRGRGPADFSLAFACPRGYRLQGEQPRCVRGTWTSDFPTCLLAEFPVASVATAKPNTDLIPCVLPESPENGLYVVHNASTAAAPGQATPSATLTVHCDPGYMEFGSASYCISGIWIPEVLPKCTRFCSLPNNTGTTYMWLQPGEEDGIMRHRNYSQIVPSGTAVLPQCSPHYFYNEISSGMLCRDGFWDNIAICRQECGLLTPSGEPLVVGGQASVHSQIPWHALVYDKSRSPYRQICGGSLVSTTVVISAAHCFLMPTWAVQRVRLRSAREYAVAVGKVYRSWGEPLPRGTQTSVQTSDVRELKIPINFMGISSSVHNDIALLILATPVVFDTFVQPVCLDFYEEFESRQLRSGNEGKMLSWVSEKDDQRGSDILSPRSLPYVDEETCIANSDSSFIDYLTVDKFCAGSQQGLGISEGDIGAGLSFSANNGGKQRYYLRGIASTVKPLYITRERQCGHYSFIGFTRVRFHENFIKKYMRELL